MKTEIWVVGSGKGGVGKSFFTANMGITLARMGKKVLLIDLDFSGANLHTSLGVTPVAENIKAYIFDQLPLQQTVKPTLISKLDLVQGYWGQWSSLELPAGLARQVVRDCSEMGYDYVLLDLGPGAMDLHTELFYLAHERFLISSVEPTSIEKNYRFLEAFIAWSLKNTAPPEVYQKLLEAMKGYQKNYRVGGASFRAYLTNALGLPLEYFDNLDARPINLVVNEIRTETDHHVGPSIGSVAKKFYDLKLEHLGDLDFDNAVWQSLRARQPLLIEQPFTKLASQFQGIARKLINRKFDSPFLKAVV